MEEEEEVPGTDRAPAPDGPGFPALAAGAASALAASCKRPQGQGEATKGMGPGVGHFWGPISNQTTHHISIARYGVRFYSTTSF